MSDVLNAKKRLALNITTNLIVVFVNAVITIWLTRYLILKLGVSIYGLIPLAVTVASYFGLLTQSISGAIGRFVAIYIGKDDINKSCEYISSAFFSLLWLCILLLLPAAFIVGFLPHIFNIPQGYDIQARWLFAFMTIFSLITALNSTFIVSTFITHRFYLRNLIDSAGRILQVVIIYILFTFLSASVSYVGFAYLMMAGTALLLSYIAAKKLTPELKISFALFKWASALEMGAMGVWVTINQLGGAFYTTISIVIINIFLGSEAVGRYAPFAQLAVLIDLLGGTLASVFSPIAYGYIARNETEELVRQTKRSMKYMSMLMALPMGLLCGLSIPIFNWWLGESFSQFHPLMWILVGSRVVVVVIRPIYAITQGMNKVKLPSIITISVGVISILLSIVSVKFTNLGIYGVAISASLCLSLKNVIAAPIYGAIILKAKKMVFVKEILLAILIFCFVSLVSFLTTIYFALSTILSVFTLCLSISVIHCLVCYFVFLNKTDRMFIFSLIICRNSTGVNP